MDRMDIKADRPDKGTGGGRTASRFDVILDSVGRLLRRGAIGNLERMVSKMHPADVAKVLHHLNSAQEKRTVFELIKPDRSKAQVLSELDEGDLGEILTDVPAAEIAVLIKDLPDDDQAYVLNCLPEDRSQEVLKLMKPEDSAEVKDLLQYEPKTAGAIMTTEYFSLPEHTTAEEAIHKLQGAKDTGNVFYVYVTDTGDRLVGVLSLRQLLQVPPHTRLGTMIKRDVISVATDTDQEEVAKLVGRYNLLAIPVVDAEGRVLGVITVDDVIDVITEEATEDMFRMAGLPADESIFAPVQVSARRRIPWLMLNLLTAFMAGGMVAIFEGTIAKAAALAVFMPIVAGQGGNAGIQTITIVVRSMALGEIEARDARRILNKEISLGVIRGILFGLIVGVLAWGWKGEWGWGFVVGTAMMLNMLVAGLLGTLIPLGMKAVRLDPAIASGVFLTTFTDVLGFLFLLGLATLLIGQLT